MFITVNEQGVSKKCNFCVLQRLFSGTSIYRFSRGWRNKTM